MQWILIGVAVLAIAILALRKQYDVVLLFKKLLTSKHRVGEEVAERSHDLSLVSRYYYGLIEYQSFHQTITDEVANDLDVDDLFLRVDRTTSMVGQQYLYAKLRTLGSVDDLLRFDTLVDSFERNTACADECRRTLGKLSHPDGYSLQNLLHDAHVKPMNLRFVYLLTLLFVLVLVSSFFYKPLFLLLIPIFIANLLIHYSNKPKLAPYIVAVGQLAKSTAVAKTLSKESVAREHFSDFTFLARVASIQKKARVISLEKQQNNDALLVLMFVMELIKIAFNAEVILFHRFIASIEAEKESIAKLFRFIGELDSALSVATLRHEGVEVCKPAFTAEKTIEVDSITHPLIERCTPNSLTLAGKSLLLTGSNMSGKTTFIRTLSVNAILAQTIYTCFAHSYQAPFFRLYSSIRISDSLLESTSYYLEEVLTIKEFITASSSASPCLFVMDELFKGTNTLERIAAGKAILAYLNRANHVVLVSTHDIELTELLETSGYELYHFCEEIVDGGLVFSYRLRKGELKTKNAIRILELYDYPKEVVADALETQKYLSVLEAKRR